MTANRNFRTLILLCLSISIIDCGGGGGGTAPAVSGVLDFKNPGFELPVLAAGTNAEPLSPAYVWTGEPGLGVANGNSDWGTAAEAGSQYAFLQSSYVNVYQQGSCQQTVSGFTIGQSYEVTFWMAQRTGLFPTAGTAVSLTANSTVIFPATLPTADGNWKQFTSTPFIATKGSYTFEFLAAVPLSGTNQATLLDEVHIVEP